jgi:hypothetical protein
MPAGTHYSRIEAPETAPGFPDVHYTFKSMTGTMELKAQEFPQGEFPFKGAMRKGQKQWIAEELTAAGKVILVLQLRQVIYFLDGQHAQHLDEMTEDNIRNVTQVVWEKGGNCNIPALAEFMTS